MNIYSTPLYGVANGKGMNAIRNMHEVRVPNIYILFNIVYYVLPLTIIIIWTIKAVGFLKARQTHSNIFAMRYGNIKG